MSAQPSSVAVDRRSTAHRQLIHRDCLVAWIADVRGSEERYRAVPDARDTAARVSVRFADLGFDGPCRVRDLCRRASLGRFEVSSLEYLPHTAPGSAAYHPPRRTEGLAVERYVTFGLDVGAKRQSGTALR